MKTLLFYVFTFLLISSYSAHGALQAPYEYNPEDLILDTRTKPITKADKKKAKKDPNFGKQWIRVTHKGTGKYLFSIENTCSAAGIFNAKLLQAKRNKTTLKKFGNGTAYTSEWLINDLSGENSLTPPLPYGITEYNPKTQINFEVIRYKKVFGKIKYRPNTYSIIFYDKEGTESNRSNISRTLYRKLKRIKKIADDSEVFLNVNTQILDLIISGEAKKTYKGEEIPLYFYTSHKRLPNRTDPSEEDTMNLPLAEPLKESE